MPFRIGPTEIAIILGAICAGAIVLGAIVIFLATRRSRAKSK